MATLVQALKKLSETWFTPPRSGEIAALNLTAVQPEEKRGRATNERLAAALPQLSWPRRAITMTLSAILLTSLAHAQAPASVASKFAGYWVEDPSKRTNDAMRSLIFKQGTSGLEELRGSQARPLMQPVRFGDTPYQINGSNNSLVWKQLGPGQFQRALVADGKTISTRKIQVSADGQTLTEATETNLMDGTKSNATIVYKRTSGNGQGLAGVWKPQSFRTDTPATLRVETAGDALKVAMPNQSFTLTLDGKPATVMGPSVITGTTVAGRVANERTLEMNQVREGVATGKVTWTLSGDGKTLTQSNVALGPDATEKPSITVYQKH